MRFAADLRAFVEKDLGGRLNDIVGPSLLVAVSPPHPHSGQGMDPSQKEGAHEGGLRPGPEYVIN